MDIHIMFGGCSVLMTVTKKTQFLSKLFPVIAETSQQVYLPSDSQSQGFHQAVT